jgi:hypothetical protein
MRRHPHHLHVRKFDRNEHLPAGNQKAIAILSPDRKYAPETDTSPSFHPSFSASKERFVSMNRRQTMLFTTAAASVSQNITRSVVSMVGA